MTRCVRQNRERSRTLSSCAPEAVPVNEYAHPKVGSSGMYHNVAQLTRCKITTIIKGVSAHQLSFLAVRPSRKPHCARAQAPAQ